MPYNDYVYCVAGIGGLANDDRNGKADKSERSAYTKR